MIAREYNAAQIPRRIRLAALLAVGGLTLAACGAQVSSELEVSDDQSGTRTIVASIAEEDIEELSGGIEAAEAALEAHLPDELSFAGISQTDSDEEEAAGETDSYLAEFELAFSDLDDYQTKAQALLDLAVEKEEAIRDSSEPDVDHTTVQVDFVENDGPLLDGFILEENFTGSDLLDWTSYALVEDGVVDEENANSIIGSAGDESRVLFNGEEYEATEPFSISEGEDQRFSDVDVRITDDGAQVDFVAPFNSSDYDTGFELGQQYLEDADIGEIQSEEDGYWTVSLDDSASLEEQLSTLLDTESLQVEVEETANTEDASLLTTLTGTGFSCPTVCRETPSISVDWSSENLTPVDEEAEGDTFTISYERAVPLEEVEIATELSLSGAIAQTYRFSVDSSHAETFGEDLQKIFAPPEDTGSIDTETQDDTVVYVATLDSADPEEFNAILDEYLPGSMVFLSGFENFGIWPKYTLDVDSYGVETLGVVPVQNVSLPMMHSADLDASYGLNDDLDSDQTDYRLAAAGPTLSGMFLVGGLLVVAIVIIVVIVVFRKRIAAGLRSAQEQAQTMAQTTSASWQAANQQQSAAAGQQTPYTASAEPTDDASWKATFHEGKLH